VQLENGLITTRVTNAGGAEVYGLELESTWQATENLLLSAGYTYLDTEYTDFKVTTSSAGQIAYSGGCTPVTFDNGDQRCRISYDGNNLEDAPENAFVGSARYERAWNSQVDWFLEGNSEYLDELTSDEWEVVAFVDNMLDDEKVKSGLNNIDQRYLAVDALTFAVLVPNSARYLLPEPRTYGVRFNYRFGGQ
jgi:iron complex outermembrane receptor protein